MYKVVPNAMLWINCNRLIIKCGLLPGNVASLHHNLPVWMILTAAGFLKIHQMKPEKNQQL